MDQVYAQALISVIATGTLKPETALVNLRQVLRARGHERLWPKILIALEREYALAEKQSTPILRIARSSDAKSEIVQQLKSTLAKTDLEPKIIIDDTIIGGATLRTADTLIDASYKTILTKLYQTITK